MGSEIAGHVFRAKVSLEPLRELPKSVAYSARSDGNHVFLDLFPPNSPPAEPLTSFTFLPAADGNLPAVWNHVTRILARHDTPVPSEVTKQIATSLRLSTMLDTSVLSFIADDDELDAAVVTKQGNVVRLHLRCGWLDIIFSGGEVTVQELLSEDGDEDEDRPEASLKALAAIDRVTVRPRPRRLTLELHRIPMDEIERFLGGGPVPEWSGLPVIAGVASKTGSKTKAVDRERIRRLRSAYQWPFHHTAYKAAQKNDTLAAANVSIFSQNALVCAMASLLMTTTSRVRSAISSWPSPGCSSSSTASRTSSIPTS